MKPIAAPIVGGMITSAVHVLILVPVFFVMVKARQLKRGTRSCRKRARPDYQAVLPFILGQKRLRDPGFASQRGWLPPRLAGLAFVFAAGPPHNQVK